MNMYFKKIKFKITNLLFVSLALTFISMGSMIIPLKNIFIKTDKPIKGKDCYIENNPPKTKILSASPLCKYKALSFLTKNPGYEYDNPIEFIIGINATATVVQTNNTSGTISTWINFS
jgi:hypothetical protein